jgi:hypothetical protein
MHKSIDTVFKIIMPKLFVYAALLIYIVIFYKITFQRGSNFGTIFSSLPLICIGAFLLFKHPLWSFLFLYIANYFVMGAMRYISFPGGILMDAIIFFCFTSLLIKTYKPSFANNISLVTVLLTRAYESQSSASGRMGSKS